MTTVAYLRFADEAEGRKALEAAFQKGDTGLCVIGEAWRNDVDPPVKRSGWFANWIGEELPENLSPYAITPEPEFPFCIFAGHPPALMKARDDAVAALAAEAVAARLAAEEAARVEALNAKTDGAPL